MNLVAARVGASGTGRVSERKGRFYREQAMSDTPLRAFPSTFPPQDTCSKDALSPYFRQTSFPEAEAPSAVVALTK